MTIPTSSSQTSPDTRGADYTNRLVGLETKWWRRILDPQIPYRWNMRRLEMGFTLDIGCGIGRNLRNLCGHGIGVDHNPQSVAVAVSQGLRAYTSDAFTRSDWAKPASFDSLLLSHVVEHMTPQEAVPIIAAYLPYLKPGGKIVIITPQEAGYRSDATHVTFMDFAAVAKIARDLQFTTQRQFSFPFPRWVGRYFTYNEFVSVFSLRGK